MCNRKKWKRKINSLKTNNRRSKACYRRCKSAQKNRNWLFRADEYRQVESRE